MWFTENAWPPIIFLAAAGLVLGMIGMSRQQTRYYGFAGLCFTLCLVVWIVEQQVVTEGEKIERRIYDLVAAFQQNDIERTLSYFSKSNLSLLATVGAAIAGVDIDDDYRITDYEVTLKADQTLATTHFRVNATANVALHGDVGRQPTRWLVDWRIERGEWMITEVHRLKLVGPVTETMSIWKMSR
ncbi:MAG TPA: hypothetical protein VLA12_14680 [Planctomycetaceae bacterium]|nr:hypothetical protein [Planctomycetaceae bacterium]